MNTNKALINDGQALVKRTGKEKEMSGEQRVHKWYIESLDVPPDNHTNEILAKNQAFISEEYIFDGVKCEDDKPHKMWGCEGFWFVNQLIKRRISWGINFKIWHQWGNGLIRVWNFSMGKTWPIPVSKSAVKPGQKLLATCASFEK